MIPPDSERLAFGNSVYTIEFETRQRSLYGHKYWFYLRDAVENVPEYVVDWDNFEKCVVSFGCVPWTTRLLTLVTCIGWLRSTSCMLCTKKTFTMSSKRIRRFLSSSSSWSA